MSLFSFSFNGRIDRKTFIFRIVVWLILAGLFAFILDYLNIVKINTLYDTYMNATVMEIGSYVDLSSMTNMVILGVMALVLVLHCLSSVVRRLHDMNKTGWWALLMFLGCLHVYPLALNFDMWPTIQLVLSFVPLILVIILVLFRGTEGTNDYGA